MLVEHEIFSADERRLIDFQLFHNLANFYGDINWPESLGYLTDYAGICAKYKPNRILEIGVRHGYSALAMFQGLKNIPFEYLGLDNEDSVRGSCSQAQTTMKNYGWDVKVMKWDTAHGLPKEIGAFDLVHVDGDHSRDGVFRDINLSWSVLNPKGIIIIDDAKASNVAAAIQDFKELNRFQGENLYWQNYDNEYGHMYFMKG